MAIILCFIFAPVRFFPLLSNCFLLVAVLALLLPKLGEGLMFGSWAIAFGVDFTFNFSSYLGLVTMMGVPILALTLFCTYLFFCWSTKSVNKKLGKWVIK